MDMAFYKNEPRYVSYRLALIPSSYKQELKMKKSAKKVSCQILIAVAGSDLSNHSSELESRSKTDRSMVIIVL